MLFAFANGINLQTRFGEFSSKISDLNKELGVVVGTRSLLTSQCALIVHLIDGRLH